MEKTNSSLARCCRPADGGDHVNTISAMHAENAGDCGLLRTCAKHPAQSPHTHTHTRRAYARLMYIIYDVVCVCV